MKNRTAYRLSVAGLACLIFCSWQDENRLAIEPRAYMLGAVNDYLGRSYVPKSTELRDWVADFHHTERPLLDQIVTLLSGRRYTFQVTPRIEADCTNCNEFDRLKSEQLAAEINSSYSFGTSKGWDEQENKSYTGRLTRPHLRRLESRLSFLTGAYARYGQHQGDVYTISLANSTGKYGLILAQLKAVNCKIISTTVDEGVPASQRVCFVPDAELKQYLETQNAVVDSVAAQRRRYFAKKTAK